MRAVDLLTAGEAFQDLVFMDLPRLPQPGEEVRTRHFFQTVGGGAVITAVAGSRLGLRCGIVSGLSPAAATLLREEGVQVLDVRRQREPFAISAALSTKTNRSFVTFNGMNERLESRLALPVRRTPARHLHFAFGPSSCARWARLVGRLRRRGVTTSWDFGWNEGLLRDRAFLALAGALDYLFINEQESLLYSGSKSLSQSYEFWKARTRTTIVKLGARGSRWIAADLEVSARPPAVRVVDTTGAGDAFNGGFLHARLRGRSPAQSLSEGNRLGALSTRAPGGIDGLPRRRRRR